jgi:hypothetical protein
MKWTVVVLMLTSVCLVGVGRADGRAKQRPTGSPKVTAKAHKPRAAKGPAKRRVSAAHKARAKRLYRLGKRYFRQKKYAKAVEAFKKAYGYRKHPLILYNTALVLSLQGQGKKLDAAMFLRKYRTAMKGRLPNLPKRLQKALDDTGVLIITTPDPKAAIFVDGLEVGKGSAEITALVGNRAVDIVVKNRIVARRVIDLRSDSIKVWELLEMPNAPVDRTHPRIRPQGGGKAKPSKRPVHILDPPVTRVPSRNRGLHWAYFSAAAGVAVATLGAAMGLSFTIRKIDKDCRAAPCTTAESDKGFRLQYATNALWGLAGGAAVTAAILVFFTRWKKTEKSAVSVLPVVGPGNVGLTLTWER